MAGLLKKAGLGGSIKDLESGTMRCNRETFCSQSDERAVGAIAVDLVYACVANLKRKGGDAAKKAVSMDMAGGKSLSGMFDKYSGGFEGSFGEISMYFGGLDQLLGAPQKNVGAAIEQEHCGVKGGFGESTAQKTANNYGVTFTPMDEYLFVADPRKMFHKKMNAGSSGGRDLGFRQRVGVDTIFASAVLRIQASYQEAGWDVEAVNQHSFDALEFKMEELISLRMYTGPLFMVYNTVLRAMATGGVIKRGPAAGQPVKGLFTTTIHAIVSWHECLCGGGRGGEEFCALQWNSCASSSSDTPRCNNCRTVGW